MAERRNKSGQLLGSPSPTFGLALSDITDQASDRTYLHILFPICIHLSIGSHNITQPNSLKHRYSCGVDATGGNNSTRPLVMIHSIELLSIQHKLLEHPPNSHHKTQLEQHINLQVQLEDYGVR